MPSPMRLSLNDETNMYSTCPQNFELDIDLEEREKGEFEEGKEMNHSVKNKSESKKYSSILQILERKSPGEVFITQN